MPVPKGVSPEKFDRCVDDVKEQGGAKNAYAICNSSLKRSEIDWSDMEKSIQEFNSFFKGELRSGHTGARHIQMTHMKDGKVTSGHSKVSSGSKIPAQSSSAGEKKKQSIGRMMAQEKIKPNLPR